LQRIVAELLDECEGARTPALLLPDELTPLTRRELEVAAMAAQGWSSEEIARRLVLSVRTVDNHLGHVYQKLGVTSRGELKGVLEPSTSSALSDAARRSSEAPHRA
jgi:DNA-binding CsgD family transcriptional regulator